MLKKIKGLAKRYASEFISIRRHLHAHTELRYKDFQAAQYVQQKLSDYNIPFEIKVTTGVVGIIKGKNSHARTVALRTDMVALYIQEEMMYPAVSCFDRVQERPHRIQELNDWEAETPSGASLALLIGDICSQFVGDVSFELWPGNLFAA